MNVTLPNRSAEAGATAIRADSVSKAFGATRAIRDASVEIAVGEIQALLGENGSGKSTLVKILAGIQQPDAGTVEIGAGTSRSRAESRAYRSVATVFQEVLIATGLSVLDNVWLGTDRLLTARVSRARKRADAAEVLRQLTGRSFPLDVLAATLSLSDQQAVCIARALVRQPDVLLLDESTSTLDIGTRDRLFAILRRLAGEGMSTVFISHRMDEILAIADRITVMRSGVTVGTHQREGTTARALVELMAGSAGQELRAADHDREAAIGRVALRADGLTLVEGSVPFDFAVREGEIVGVAGLEGHGQQELLLALAGHRPVAGTVTVDTSGSPSRVNSPHQALAHHIAYVPRDRRRSSTFASRSIADNFAAATLERDAVAGVYRPVASRRRLDAYRSSLRIRMGSPDQPITTLSGGNQQKVVLARWLASEPRVLLLNDPTRGIDIGAKKDIYRLLRGLADDGIAIVLVSSEIDEHLHLVDRCVVMREGTAHAELVRSELSESRLIGEFFGRTEGVRA